MLVFMRKNLLRWSAMRPAPACQLASGHPRLSLEKCNWKKTTI